MGGTINATSEPRRGSTFHFEIPLEIPTTIGAPNEVAQSSADVAAASGMPSWSRPPLVLIVEDSQINQIVAARALERCGCRTHFVNDAEEAIKAFRAQRYDAILMDCQMPNLDGYRATAELRQTEHGERHTPIIAMTAHAMQGDRERCLAAGMDDCLAKPMRHNDLQTLLRRWIGPETKDTAPEDRRSA
jgi:CheY-like chemotaxis protein